LGALAGERAGAQDGAKRAGTLEREMADG
jgi:hypothetical protein